MDRRDFLKSTAFLSAFGLLGGWEEAFASGCRDASVGKRWGGWKKGHFQVHFIYTGVAESMFFILPDGTTMLLDCGDFDALARGAKAVPLLPGPGRHAGEWIARYVRRVNPADRDVDYMMLSHYHNDHAGCLTFNAGLEERDGKPYSVSGFGQAAEYLHFDKAIDRCWPDYCDPLPFKEDSNESYPHMKYVYDYLQRHEGLKIEKFELGALNQVRMLNDPGRYPDFFIRNICGNGRLWHDDGTVTDLFKEYFTIRGAEYVNVYENWMSLGMVVGYGPFRFFTAGDLYASWRNPDGTRFCSDDYLAEVCGKADVAKLNHHGHYSMKESLVRALGSRVWVSCVWDQLHNTADVMKRLTDRSIYPGDRIICPGIIPVERRRKAEQAGETWLNDVADASFEGGHIVLDVQPGGKRYSITYLSAEDESMTVRSVMHFNSFEK